jgi:hypothetical protein
MRRLHRPPHALHALAIGTSAGLAEDLDPAALFESAKASYEAKKYGKAIADLKLLAGEVARRRGEVLKAFLPGAPAGWTAEEAEAADLAGGLFFAQGIQVRRRYTKGEAEGEAELIVDSPMLAGALAMMQMAGQMPGYSVVKVKGRTAILEQDKEAKSASVSIVLGGNTALLKISGRNVAKEDVVDVLGGAFDLDGLDKAIAE